MGAHEGPRRKPRHKAGPPGHAADPYRIKLRTVPGQDACELVHPRCVRDRRADFEEVHTMLDMGEIDLAVDELRYLLEGCPPLIEAHKLLGEIALADGDLELARPHLERACQLGETALPKGPLPARLAADRPANQPFFEAGKALALCLRRLDEEAAARALVDRLLALDPADPLRVSDVFAA